jgi:hypothetical protein
LITGVFAISGVFVSENWQDRRQATQIVADLTAEAARSLLGHALDPDAPPTGIPTLEPTITPVPDAAFPSPLQVIPDYYAALNSGDYLSAWNMLSEEFRRRSLDDNYPAYEAFWMSAGLVNVVELIPLEVADFDAEALVRLYWEAERRTRAYTYSLILDLASDSWKIDAVAGVR